MSNSRPHCRDTIVAVPGAASAANSLLNVGEVLLASSVDVDGGGRACRFIALELPDHGASSPPVGALFGDLRVEDYSHLVLSAISRLQERGIHTSTLMGHSMGGMVVELTQQILVDQGTSLRDAYDVDHVVALAPAVWPGGTSCALCENTEFAATLGVFIAFDPGLGLYLPRLPGAVYLALAFSKPDGSLPSNAPTPAEVDSRGYAANESVAAIEELLAADPNVRPYLAAGIFGKEFGTRLDVVAFQYDTLVLPPEAQANYEYATGESAQHGFTTVEGPDAVHGMPEYAAAAMLGALEGRVRLP
jgi:pimeloyl-ACP methyl ester carboxylesterase